MAFGNESKDYPTKAAGKVGFQACNDLQESIAIVACLHGNEIIGKKTLDDLQDVQLLRGGMNYMIGNPKATEQNKRYMDVDLNRCFPWQQQWELRGKNSFRIKR